MEELKIQILGKWIDPNPKNLSIKEVGDDVFWMFNILPDIKSLIEYYQATYENKLPFLFLKHGWSMTSAVFFEKDSEYKMISELETVPAFIYFKNIDDMMSFKLSV